MVGTQQSGPWGKLVHEKIRKSKISCPCTFKEEENNCKIFHNFYARLKTSLENTNQTEQRGWGYPMKYDKSYFNDSV